MDVYTFREGDLVTGAGSTLGTYDIDNLDQALCDLKSYFSCVHFEYEGSFIADEDLVTLIIQSHISIIIATNHGITIYVDHGIMNEPRFSV